ncbi:MAG: L,D-transpeptidase, partial [Gaiellaceae bacterium]
RPIRPFAVTVVARIAGAHVTITRTVIISIRAYRVSLVGPRSISRWAYVLQASDARAEPAVHAPSVGRVDTATSDAVPNLVRVLAEQRNADRSTWVRVELTSLPNSRIGWVPRATLAGYHAVVTRLVIDTERLTLTLYRSGRSVFRAQVGVGQSRWPTPQGSFYIRERLTDFHDPFYGPIAFGTSARSTTLTDWPGGGVVGIHGTNEPGLIPGRISHGCVRLRNADILRLARLLPLGTPLLIR